MEMYPAIEFMPVYNTFLIIMNIFCGAIILDEAKMYDSWGLIKLGFFVCVCISGIFVLVKKPDLDCYIKRKPDPIVTDALSE